jgi:hypothetical protein
MTRGPLRFKETELVRAIKSALKAGLQVAGFEINPTTGNIVVHTDKPEEKESGSDINPWDRAIGYGEDH